MYRNVLMFILVTEDMEEDPDNFQTTSLADAMEDFNLYDHQEWKPCHPSK